MMGRLLKICALLISVSIRFELSAQAVCDATTSSNCNSFPFSELLLQNQQNSQLVEFSFDNFSEYNSGITYYGSTLLRLKVTDSISGPGTCAWKLKMHITNGGSPVPIQEWETTASYGLSGAKPQLDMIQVRVTNACSTSPINGTWQSFAAIDNADILIIDNAFPQSAGTLYGCSGGQTNGPGSYLTNPGEYTFNIDYRIVPGFSRTPGKYEMSIKFCLSE
jgi:hypothetical protein